MNYINIYQMVISKTGVVIPALLLGGILGMGLHGFVTSKFGPVCQIEYISNGEFVQKTIAQKHLDEMFESKRNGNISDLVVKYCGEGE